MKIFVAIYSKVATPIGSSLSFLFACFLSRRILSLSLLVSIEFHVNPHVLFFGSLLCCLIAQKPYISE